MLVTKKSPFSGKENTMDIDVSEDQINQWRRGSLIQNVMPKLTPDEREFLMTGITPDEWESMGDGDE